MKTWMGSRLQVSSSVPQGLRGRRLALAFRRHPRQALDAWRGRPQMWRSSTLRAATLVAIALWLAPQSAWSQSRPEFIPFQGRSKGALYRPDSGPAPHVGVLVMHRTSNYLAHRACTELSRRGFLMLCMNTRYENNEALVDFEKLPLDQAAAENGTAYCKGASKLTECGDDLAGLPRADGIVFTDAHPGNSVNT